MRELLIRVVFGAPYSLLLRIKADPLPVLKGLANDYGFRIINERVVNQGGIWSSIFLKGETYHSLVIFNELLSLWYEGSLILIRE